MSYKYRILKENQIIQREIEKQKNAQLSKMKHLTVDIKMTFFKDILSKSFPNDTEVWDKIEARKLALVKHGYGTKEGEITDLGYERLIKYLLKKASNPT